MYYACLENKDGTIIKVPFKDRNDARAYIADIFNPEIHSKCWTE